MVNQFGRVIKMIEGFCRLRKSCIGHDKAFYWYQKAVKPIWGSDIAIANAYAGSFPNKGKDAILVIPGAA